MIHSHEESGPAAPDGGSGTDTGGIVMPNEAAMPGDTGWSPKATGMVLLGLPEGPGAFWAPRTLAAEPRGRVHRAEVFVVPLLVSCGLRRTVPW
jgi:hypothetical protein